MTECIKIGHDSPGSDSETGGRVILKTRIRMSGREAAFVAKVTEVSIKHFEWELLVRHLDENI